LGLGVKAKAANARDDQLKRVLTGLSQSAASLQPMKGRQPTFSCHPSTMNVAMERSITAAHPTDAAKAYYELTASEAKSIGWPA
jgi:hypothetical protein